MVLFACSFLCSISPQNEQQEMGNKVSWGFWWILIILRFMSQGFRHIRGLAQMTNCCYLFILRQQALTQREYSPDAWDIKKKSHQNQYEPIFVKKKNLYFINSTRFILKVQNTDISSSLGLSNFFSLSVSILTPVLFFVPIHQISNLIS